MIYNYSTLDNQKALKTLARPLHSKLKKIQGLFNTVRTLKKCAACKSFCFAYYTCCLFDFLVFIVVVVALSLLPHKRNNIVDIADMRQSCLNIQRFNRGTVVPIHRCPNFKVKFISFKWCY